MQTSTVSTGRSASKFATEAAQRGSLLIAARTRHSSEFAATGSARTCETNRHNHHAPDGHGATNQQDREMNNYKTKFHKDRTVTIWNVYAQAWQRLQADLIPDQVLATLNDAERKRIAAIGATYE
jgi:hypothetical protein